jgi:hypothetical protein
MSLIARRPQASYALAPVGMHPAVCVDIQNLGLQTGAYGQKHKVRLVWQLDALDDSGRRVEVARLYTLSLHERAALRQDLERWRGKKFTDTELDAGFDLEKLLSVNCQVLVSHGQGGDGTTYANVDSVLPPVKGAPKLAPLAFTRLKDRAPSANGTAHGAANGAGKEADHADVVPF